MIKEVKVLSRFNMDMFFRTGGLNFPHLHRKWNLISIYDEGDGKFVVPQVKKTLTKMGCEHFLSLDFWDITPELREKISARYPNSTIFNRDHARQILEFLRKIQKEKENSVLIVHCHAGVSRSGAVATFSCDYCGLDYNEFIKGNRFIMANPHVLDVLRKKTRKNPVNGWHDGIDEGGIIPPWAQ